MWTLYIPAGDVGDTHQVLGRGRARDFVNQFRARYPKAVARVTTRDSDGRPSTIDLYIDRADRRWHDGAARGHRRLQRDNRDGTRARLP